MERNPIELNVCSIQESNGLTKADIEYFANGDDELKIDIEYLVNVFTDAKEYGSIIDVDSINLKKVNNRLLHIKEDTINLFMNNKRERIVNKIINLTKQWKIINNKYDICITNPPYMGNVGMNDIIKRYIEEQYKDTKSDLSTVFMERCFRYTTFDGFLAMVNMHSWMFLFTYEKFRNRILEKYTIDTLVHLGMEAFDNIIGKVVQTVAFVFRKKNIANYKTTNIRLVDFYDSRRHDKEKNYYNERYRYISKQSDFNEIPGHPIAYWVSKKFVDNFKVGISIESISEFTGSQNITANNEKYLRFLWEVGADSIGEGKNWVLYSKGGDYRKHYGNLEYIVNWSDNARKFYKNNKTSNLLGEKYWYKEGITYTMLSTKNTSFRYLPTGCIFDKGGPSINYIKNINYILALLNSCVVKKYLDVLNPTINIQAKDIKNIPIIIDKNYKFKVESIEKECLDISKYDWDSSETSLEFKTHPIIEFKSNNLENSFNDWMYFMENQFNQLKDNEEELNRIFIDIYDLQDELTPEVEDKDITIRKADRDREMKSFISYTVGCMMGRYSLDEEGLVYAGGEFDINKYKTFKVDEDAIIPITDNEYFKDDIVSKFVEFVKIVFGSETLEENLNYIADTECFKRKTNETSRECLRRYFLKGFMEDHLKVYQKRPIYWMFDSGKQNGFKALIYMHRYDENMVAKIRTDYLHRIQRTYESEIIRLEKDINSEVISTKEKTKAKKEKEKISKQIDECKTYDQVIAHVANQRISIDLDDGVKVNYNKFQGIEVLIGNGKKNLKANLLFKAQI